ncbi:MULTISPECIES: phosphate ABC transporter permease PstA [Bacillus]|jgi:phosphate transport system permease protein|uniref:phosphate ABC transporter permease PstA n=1 Tax=Bacillus TaxID=1386 RepID=UPI002E22F6AF|nr:phosphate ABC transporter permease PstA [Bacillus smithii]MED1421529.1 phosphate ABC transporter permease PstA [Bacillus smithii]MED1454780.1 phosphate ABC transporter permease PstA [Bacillus smithii]MED1488840.1 phosphate ABC transporter permease PstA [Bacillus smithii]
MKAKIADRVATVVFYIIALLLVLLLAGLLGYILLKGLSHISWHFITSPPESFQAGGGIGPQLFNSLYLLVLTMLISVPLSLGAGIYMAEYAKKNIWTNILRTVIEVLSSLPSIVVGLFGFLFFVISMGWGFSILSGALALTLFNLPLMVRVVEDSIRGVPSSQREAGLALGVSKWETIKHVLLPAALPGIITGIILASGRVFGEAAALIYTAGMSSPNLDFTNWNPFSPTSPLNPLRPAETLAVHIWKVNGEAVIPDVNAVSSGASAVLVLFILVFNVSARWIGKRIYRRMTSS